MPAKQYIVSEADPKLTAGEYKQMLANMGAAGNLSFKSSGGLDMVLVNKEINIMYSVATPITAAAAAQYIADNAW